MEINMTKQILKLSHSSNEDWLAIEVWKGVPAALEAGGRRGTQHTCWKTQVLFCPPTKMAGYCYLLLRSLCSDWRKEEKCPFPCYA